ncbi:FkbM family methyltransferase [Belliella marina]|uniref:FkbM family methyltransferase n=1 Tax=Belliella marina TaxID=1644146 RepID=A0ABW4VNV8_9BACT
MSLKKSIFYWITLQRRNWFGGFLKKVFRTVFHALENKNNDNQLSGEYAIWEDLKEQQIKVVFDVGANVGNWSKTISGVNNDCIVHAFEPVEETYQKLQENTKSNKLIKTNNLALSDKEETIEFNFYPKGSYFSSIYDNQLGKDAKKVSINCVKGDDYCLENGIENIDFLKIDTEGAEHKVLEGFTRMLSEKRIKIIQFEYGDMCIDSGFLLKDYFQLLEGYGFSIGKIYPKWVEFGKYEKSMENFVLSNFLAVEKSNRGLMNLFDK